MNKKKPLYFKLIPSPIGELILISCDQALHAVHIKSKNSGALVKNLTEKPQHAVLQQAAKQLKEYFQGQRKQFDLKLHLSGTNFQKKAWEALQKIPYGQTVSYQTQAKNLGDEKKARAVGTANSKNNLMIIIPCHRVISKSGALGGYAGGIKVKGFLLNHEQKT